MNTITRSALFSAACAFLAIAAAGSAAAENYPPGTNCQSLLPGLRASCMDQVRQLNSGANPESTIVPNSAGSNTVQTPGANGVSPNSTVNPNAVTPNGTVNPNGVAAPTGEPIVPPLNSGTGASAPGTTGSGTGAGGAGTGTTGN